MSRTRNKNRNKKNRKRQEKLELKLLGEIGIKAQNEGKAISIMMVTGNVQQKRLNRTYNIDGVKFWAGKKRRQGGNIGTSDNRTQPAMLWEIK